MSLTLADVANQAKFLYPQHRLESLALRKRALLNWFPKAEQLGGEGYRQSVWYEDPQSVGYNLATVIANKAKAKFARFSIEDDDFVGLYGAVGIEGKALLGTRDSLFSYLKAKDVQVQGMMRQLGKVVHTHLYGDDNEYLGVIASVSVSTNTTITFVNKSDVNKFGVGQVLTAADGADGGTPRLAAGGSATREGTVIARSRAAGTITCSGDLTTTASSATAWQAGDYVFNSGDAGTSGSIIGLAGWIPLTAPGTSDDFYGQNRSVDVERLAGFRLNTPGQDIYKSLSELGTLIGEAEGNPDTIFMHPKAGDALTEEVGVKAELVNVEGEDAKIGYGGFVIPHFINGPIKVVFDWGCPLDRAYMLTRRTWKLLHMGGLPHLVMDDGNMAMRGQNTDDIELRGRVFCQPVCESPKDNGVCAISL